MRQRRHIRRICTTIGRKGVVEAFGNISRLLKLPSELERKCYRV